MDPSKCSCEHSSQPPSSPPDGVAALAADLDALATQDLDTLPDLALANQALALRRLADRLRATGTASWPAAPWRAGSCPRAAGSGPS